jgi:hypothetical protein
MGEQLMRTGEVKEVVRACQKESRIVVGYRGQVGSAIQKLFDATFCIDFDTEEGNLEKDSFKIMHICLPCGKDFAVELFIKTAQEYIETFEPDLILNHSTTPVGTTRKLSKFCKNIAHVPVNGRHPDMADDIMHYGFFVGAIDEKIGQEVCAYIERNKLHTYLCETPELTELAKMASTELLRLNIGFYQDYKIKVRKKGLNWAEFIAFMDNIHRYAPDGVWLNRPFQRAGEIDLPISRKHCLSTNKELVK